MNNFIDKTISVNNKQNNKGIKVNNKEKRVRREGFGLDKEEHENFDLLFKKHLKQTQ